jgi:phosphoenolpyruvate-protein kinase (PTS system EI component)
MASNPLAVFLLIGLGIQALSVGTASLPEIKKVIRSVPSADARKAAMAALDAATAAEVVEILTEGISQWIDLSLFSGRWNLSAKP